MINTDGNANNRSRIYSMDGSLEVMENNNDYTHQKLGQIAGYKFLAESPNKVQVPKGTDKGGGYSYPEVSKREIEKNRDRNQVVPTIKQVDQPLPATANEGKVMGLLEDIIAEYENIDAKTLNDFLKTQVGKVATIQFFQQDSPINKIGVVLAVGDNYILLYETETDSILAAKLDEIKFVNLNY